MLGAVPFDAILQTTRGTLQTKMGTRMKMAHTSLLLHARSASCPMQSNMATEPDLCWEGRRCLVEAREQTYEQPLFRNQ